MKLCARPNSSGILTFHTQSCTSGDAPTNLSMQATSQLVPCMVEANCKSGDALHQSVYRLRRDLVLYIVEATSRDLVSCDAPLTLSTFCNLAEPHQISNEVRSKQLAMASWTGL
jgi:hypothetical protein